MQNIAQDSGKKTRDLIAERSGFGNPETMRQAQRVVRRGTSELIAAMDQGKVSISAADAISGQPKEEQKKILQMPRDEQKEVVRRIRKTRADKEADERRARDVQLFGGLYDAVKFIGKDLALVRIARSGLGSLGSCRLLWAKKGSAREPLVGY